MKIRSFIIAIASVAIIHSCSGTPECVDYWKSYVSRRVSSDISELLEQNASNADFDVSPFGEGEYYKKQAIAFYIESLQSYKNCYGYEKESDKKWSDPESDINDYVLKYYKVTYDNRWNELEIYHHSVTGDPLHINEENYGDGMQDAIDFLNYSYEHPDITISNLMKIIPSFEDVENYMVSRCSVLECEKNTDSSNKYVKVYDVIYMVQCDSFLGNYILAEVSIDDNDYTEIKILRQKDNLIDLLK